MLGSLLVFLSCHIDLLESNDDWHQGTSFDNEVISYSLKRKFTRQTNFLSKKWFSWWPLSITSCPDIFQQIIRHSFKGRVTWCAMLKTVYWILVWHRIFLSCCSRLKDQSWSHSTWGIQYKWKESRSDWDTMWYKTRKSVKRVLWVGLDSVLSVIDFLDEIHVLTDWLSTREETEDPR